MKFISADELKIGMRLAKPIYNKNGVMLYERDTKLTSQGISSIKNFGLIGIYILEPAEPLPPITEEDREFERFQTMAVFTIKEFMEEIVKDKKPSKLESLATEIAKNYGRHPGKIAFNQNLRSSEDNVYKHSLNVAILAAAIAGKMDMPMSVSHEVIIASLLHDIGCLNIPVQIKLKSVSEYTDEDIKMINKCRDEGYRLLRENADFDTGIMRDISYLHREIKDMNEKKTSDENAEIAVSILKVAYMYDTLTAMKYGEEPKSDIEAYKYLRHPMNGMNQEVVKALTRAINIVPAGCSVQFENGEKGIVLTENEDDILRPFVLSFKDNRVYNLADGSVFAQYQIKDILKTLDNRHIMSDEYKKYLNGGM